MAKTVKPKVAAAISPKALREIKRVATRRNTGHCTLAAQILEAWSEGLTYCGACGYPHPLETLQHHHGGSQ